MDSNIVQKPLRQSNLELLRLIAIFAILGSHYFFGTGLRSELCGASLLTANFLASGSRISVNVFVLIGTWFLVDLPFRAVRPIRLYLTLAFYSISITFLTLLTGRHTCVQHVVQGFFPFTFMATWYTNAYISLLLISPFLQRILKQPLRVIRTLVFLILLLVCLPASLPWMNAYDYVSDMLWFPCVYLVVGYLKHQTRAFEWGATWLYALVTCLGYAMIAVLRASSCPQVATMAELYRASIKSLPNFAIAYCVFVFFLRLRLGNVKWINKLAQSVFSVYVIHQIPALGNWHWGMALRYLQPLSGDSSLAIAVNFLVSSSALFVFCFAVDQLRIIIVDSIMRTGIVLRVAKWIEFSFKEE